MSLLQIFNDARRLAEDHARGLVVNCWNRVFIAADVELRFTPQVPHLALAERVDLDCLPFNALEVECPADFFDVMGPVELIQEDHRAPS